MLGTNFLSVLDDGKREAHLCAQNHTRVVGPLSHQHDTGRAPSGIGCCGKPTADAERPHQWAYTACRAPLDALPAGKAGLCVCVLHMYNHAAITTFRLRERPPLSEA